MGTELLKWEDWNISIKYKNDENKEKLVLLKADNDLTVEEKDAINEIINSKESIKEETKILLWEFINKEYWQEYQKLKIDIKSLRNKLNIHNEPNSFWKDLFFAVVEYQKNNWLIPTWIPDKPSEPFFEDIAQNALPENQDTLLELNEETKNKIKEALSNYKVYNKWDRKIINKKIAEIFWIIWLKTDKELLHFWLRFQKSIKSNETDWKIGPKTINTSDEIDYDIFYAKPNKPTSKWIEEIQEDKSAPTIIEYASEISKINKYNKQIKSVEEQIKFINDEKKKNTWIIGRIWDWIWEKSWAYETWKQIYEQQIIQAKELAKSIHSIIIQEFNWKNLIPSEKDQIEKLILRLEKISWEKLTEVTWAKAVFNSVWMDDIEGDIGSMSNRWKIFVSTVASVAEWWYDMVSWILEITWNALWIAWAYVYSAVSEGKFSSSVWKEVVSDVEKIFSQLTLENAKKALKMLPKALEKFANASPEEQSEWFWKLCWSFLVPIWMGSKVVKIWRVWTEVWLSTARSGAGNVIKVINKAKESWKVTLKTAKDAVMATTQSIKWTSQVILWTTAEASWAAIRVSEIDVFHSNAIKKASKEFKKASRSISRLEKKQESLMKNIKIIEQEIAEWINKNQKKLEKYRKEFENNSIKIEEIKIRQVELKEIINPEIRQKKQELEAKKQSWEDFNWEKRLEQEILALENEIILPKSIWNKLEKLYWKWNWAIPENIKNLFSNKLKIPWWEEISQAITKALKNVKSITKEQLDFLGEKLSGIDDLYKKYKVSWNNASKELLEKIESMSKSIVFSSLPLEISNKIKSSFQKIYKEVKEFWENLKTKLKIKPSEVKILNQETKKIFSNFKENLNSSKPWEYVHIITEDQVFTFEKAWNWIVILKNTKSDLHWQDIWKKFKISNNELWWIELITTDINGVNFKTTPIKWSVVSKELVNPFKAEPLKKFNLFENKPKIENLDSLKYILKTSVLENINTLEVWDKLVFKTASWNTYFVELTNKWYKINWPKDWALTGLYKTDIDIVSLNQFNQLTFHSSNQKLLGNTSEILSFDKIKKWEPLKPYKEQFQTVKKSDLAGIENIESSLKDSWWNIFEYFKESPKFSEIISNNPHLNEFDAFAIVKYTDNDVYSALNSAYRDGKFSILDLKKQSVWKQLDFALEKISNYNWKTYRWTSIPKNVFEKIKNSWWFKDPWFMSSSKHIENANNFKQSKSWEICALFEIEWKSWKDISSISSYKSEAEILFKRNSKFEVQSIEKVKWHNWVEYQHIKLKEI